MANSRFKIGKMGGSMLMFKKYRGLFMYQLATRPQSVWKIMRDSFSLYVEAYKRVVFWAIVLGALNFLSLFFSEGHIHLTLTVVMQVVVALLSIIPATAVFYDIHQTMHQKNPSIKAAFIHSMKRFLPVLGVFAIGFLGLMIAFFVIDWGRVTAFIIVMILAMYLFVTLFAWFPLVMTEDQKIFQALKSSIRLVKNNWWRTLALLFMLFVVVSVVNFLIMMIFSASISPGTAQAKNAFHLLTLCNVIATVLFIPWLYGAILLQIHNLELRQKKAAAFKKILQESNQSNES